MSSKSIDNMVNKISLLLFKGVDNSRMVDILVVWYFEVEYATFRKI